MPRWFLVVFAFATLGLAGSLTAMWFLRPRTTGPTGPDPWAQDYGLDGLRLPEFTLIDSLGRTTDQTVLDGKITIVDFIFTHCPFVCPGMASAMADLDRRLAGTDVALLSISVDPAHDSPARLRDYAQGQGANPDRWRFLTASGLGPDLDAEKRAISSLVLDGLGFALEPDPARRIDLPGGAGMENIIHPSKLVLIGPDRRVLGLYAYDRDEDLAALAARARLLDFERTRR